MNIWRYNSSESAREQFKSMADADPVQTAEIGIQTSPVKYRLLEDSETEILSDDATGAGQRARKV